jgi:hypothetical protein
MGGDVSNVLYELMSHILTQHLAQSQEVLAPTPQEEPGASMEGREERFGRAQTHRKAASRA